LKSIRCITRITTLLLVLIALPVPSFAAAPAAPKIVITNINIHRGATVSRDLIEVGVTINSPTEIVTWSLQLLSNVRAFSSRSELAQFAADTKGAGTFLISRAGASPLMPLTTSTASISLTGSEAKVRDLGVHGYWLQLVANGTVAKSIPFFAYGSGGSAIKPTPITWMLPLVEPPHRDLLGNFNDDDLAKTLAPDGRLGRILNFGNGPLVTWLIDPDLVESAAAMARGYTYGQGKPGAGKAVAAAWLAQLQNVVAGGQVVALPYGDPDLVTMAQAGLKNNLARTISDGVIRLSALLQRPVTNLAAWSNAGLVNNATRSLIESSSATTVLYSSASIVSAQTATDSSVLNPRAFQNQLLYDATLAHQLGDLTPLSANRVAAELTMITAERPAIARAQLLLPPRLWNPNNESMASVESLAPVHGISLDQLIASPVTAKNAFRVSKISPLNDGETTALRTVSKNLVTFSSVSQVGSQVVENEMLRSALLLSTSWRGRGFNAYLYAQRAEIASQGIVRQVRVLNGRYTLTTLHQNLPITIANDSSEPATVTLQLTPTTFRVRQPKPIRLTLEAKSKTQVMVPIRAITSGDLTLLATVLTPKGEILGDMSELTLSIRTVPAIANWIMEGAGIALVLGSAAQITRRLRRRKRQKLAALRQSVDQP
jgi:hypothetical protein